MSGDETAALLIGFLNTLHLPDAVDGLVLADPQQWIADGLSGDGRGLHDVGEGARAAAPRELRELRESLRTVVGQRGSRSGSAESGQTVADRSSTIDRVLRTYPVVLQLGSGSPRLVPWPPTGSDGTAFSAVASALFRCASTGAFARVKTCARWECQWAFFDASRNCSRRWCSMSGCGNLVKNRHYRARTRP